MSKKKNNNPIAAFQGLSYINAILKLIEECSRTTLKEQIISPKFIYRGITKRYVNNSPLYDQDKELLGNKNVWSYKSHEETYRNIQTKILQDIGNAKYDAYKTLLSLYKEEHQLCKYLKPEIIRSGASIRLGSEDDSYLTPASYIHYIRNIINEVKQSYPNYKENTDLEILADLQHKGGASCLVDFSNNILISLWFATQGDDSDFGYLYLYDINADAFMRDNISFISNRNSGNDIGQLLLQTRKTSSYAAEYKYRFWSWRPSNINSRIARQDSIFIFGMEPFSIEEHKIKVITIVPTWKQPIQSALKTFFGLTAETIYPDSDGFAMSNSKLISLSPPTSYINPNYNINNYFNDIEYIQYGISCLVRGDYQIAIKLFHHFEGVNKEKISSIDKLTLGFNSIDQSLILVELYYSIAYSYQRSNMLWNAEPYFRKAFNLSFSFLSYKSINQNMQVDGELIMSSTAKAHLNEEYIKQYLKNKLFKITDDYIDTLYNLKEYKKAIIVVDLVKEMENTSSDVKEVLLTVRIYLNLLNLLNKNNNNNNNNNEKYTYSIHLYRILNMLFDLVLLCNNSNSTEPISKKIKKENDKICQLLESEINKDPEHKYLFWDFINIKKAINKKIKSKPILQMLESTIAKIENYQNIRRNNINY